MVKPNKLWDAIIRDPNSRFYRIPPLCYLPPIWEMLLNKEILETAAGRKLLADDPIPVVKYLEARIELTKMLVKEMKLDKKIGQIAIDHFQAHLNEISAIPINIP